MKSETAKSGMRFWKWASIVAQLLLLLEVVAISAFVWKLVCEPSINWWKIAVFSVIALVLLSLSISLCNTVHSNFRTSWRIVEHYEYKQTLVTFFEEHRTNFTDVVSQDLLNPTDTRCDSQKPITAQHADYKLAEMVIENLSVDPSKRMFE